MGNLKKQKRRWNSVLSNDLDLPQNIFNKVINLRQNAELQNYSEISNDRARELGKMIASFKDSTSKPIGFNSTAFIAKCFGYTCTLLIKDNDGCWYKEQRDRYDT